MRLGTSVGFPFGLDIHTILGRRIGVDSKMPSVHLTVSSPRRCVLPQIGTAMACRNIDMIKDDVR